MRRSEREHLLTYAYNLFIFKLPANLPIQYIRKRSSRRFIHSDEMFKNTSYDACNFELIKKQSKIAAASLATRIHSFRTGVVRSFLLLQSFYCWNARAEDKTRISKIRCDIFLCAIEMFKSDALASDGWGLDVSHFFYYLILDSITGRRRLCRCE